MRNLRNILKCIFLVFIASLSGIIFVGYYETNAEQSQFPHWLQKTSNLWREGQISDAEFLSDITYLEDKGIIKNGNVGSVLQMISWKPNVTVSQQGDNIVVKSDGLPDHHTGSFPNQYNPNSIQKQDYNFIIPSNPQIAPQTTTLPMGPIGMMLNGVVFFNAYNTQGQDAVEMEVFDDCNGHPDLRGSYHYHQYSPCLTNDTVGEHSPLIGYAFDGFPIYGLQGDGGVSPTDLDSCNGHYDKVRGYHYHATKGFPYLLGCYKGTAPTQTAHGGNGPVNALGSGSGNGFIPGQRPPPPRPFP